jgi:NTP pyrophosphatase (non-canonical NTP hydrolase)
MIPEQVYRIVVEKFGKTSQVNIFFEELAELQNAVCKYLRGRCAKLDVAEEIADARITTAQIMIMLGISEEMIEEQRERKLTRLEGMVRD